MKDNKQIEEMAKDLKEIEADKGHQLINETLAYVKENHKYNPKKDYLLAHTKTIEQLTAEGLYDLGYRKIDKDSVVLSREEYESDLTAQYDVGYEFGSKETAEKYSEMVTKFILELFKNARISGSQRDLLLKRNKKLAKQFGVEIKE